MAQNVATCVRVRYLDNKYQTSNSLIWLLRYKFQRILKFIKRSGNEYLISMFINSDVSMKFMSPFYVARWNQSDMRLGAFGGK